MDRDPAGHVPDRARVGITPVFSYGLNGYRGNTARMTSRGVEKMTLSTIGIDISKDHLDVHRLPAAEAWRFSNDKAGHKALIGWLSSSPVARIVYEPTGPVPPDALVTHDHHLAERLTILASIPAISRITAFALISEMPELGHSESKQAASLAGLAPIARQSGRWTGRAFIRGGRASLRQAHLKRIQILESKRRLTSGSRGKI